MINLSHRKKEKIKLTVKVKYVAKTVGKMEKREHFS